MFSRITASPAWSLSGEEIHGPIPRRRAVWIPSRLSKNKLSAICNKIERIPNNKGIDIEGVLVPNEEFVTVYISRVVIEQRWTLFTLAELTRDQLLCRTFACPLNGIDST